MYNLRNSHINASSTAFAPVPWASIGQRIVEPDDQFHCTSPSPWWQWAFHQKEISCPVFCLEWRLLVGWRCEQHQHDPCKDQHMMCDHCWPIIRDLLLLGTWFSWDRQIPCSFFPWGVIFFWLEDSFGSFIVRLQSDFQRWEAASKLSRPVSCQHLRALSSQGWKVETELKAMTQGWWEARPLSSATSKRTGPSEDKQHPSCSGRSIDPSQINHQATLLLLPGTKSGAAGCQMSEWLFGESQPKWLVRSEADRLTMVITIWIEFAPVSK